MVDTGPTAYWSGEFGAGLAIVAVLIALITRRLPRPALPLRESIEPGATANGPD